MYKSVFIVYLEANLMECPDLAARDLFARLWNTHGIQLGGLSFHFKSELVRQSKPSIARSTRLTAFTLLCSINTTSTANVEVHATGRQATILTV